MLNPVATYGCALPFYFSLDTLAPKGAINYETKDGKNEAVRTYFRAYFEYSQYMVRIEPKYKTYISTLQDART